MKDWDRLITVEEMEAATASLLENGKKVGADSWQQRVKNQTPHCGFGEAGTCCRICSMGPCRITPKSPRGICGCDVHGIVGRNFLRFTAGGAAAPKLGGTKSGYQLAKTLGHKCTRLHPSLVQLNTDPTWPKSLKGVRADAVVKLLMGQELAAEEAGQVQFTDYGVSGPVIFQLSRLAVTADVPVLLSLDLLPHVSQEELVELLAQRQMLCPGLTLENLLTGMLHNRLGRRVIRYGGRKLGDAVMDLTRKNLTAIAKNIKDFRLPVTGDQGLEHAQVTAGGLDTSQFDPETLESRRCPGLYAAGEVLDVDGDCGGFNLQWAWSSGHLAGLLQHR